MATPRLLVLIPVTLCFLLVLAAAEQGKATTTLLVIHGRARCRSNFSRIISNAPMHLVINNATVPGGTGRTTSDGQLLMTVSLNSTEQLAALLNNGSSKAFLVAPPHACGAPSLPPGMELAAAVHPIAVVTITGDDDAGSSVQRPALAASDTTPPFAPVVNGSLHATNSGDAVHLNAQLHKGDPSHLNGPVQIVVAEFECSLVCTLFAGGGGGGVLDDPYDPNSNEHYFIGNTN